MKRKIKKHTWGLETSHVATLDSRAPPAAAAADLPFTLVDCGSLVGRGDAGSGWRSSSQCDMMADVEITFE